MQKKFRFKKNKLSMTLNNRRFSICVTEQTIEACEKIRQGAKMRLAELDECTEEHGCIMEIQNFMERGVNMLLGTNATRRIFGRRKINLCDLSDLLCFVISQISEHIKDGEGEK